MEDLLKELKNNQKFESIIFEMRSRGLVQKEEDLDMLLLAAAGTGLMELLGNKGVDLESLNVQTDEDIYPLIDQYEISEEDIIEYTVKNLREQLN